MKKIFALFVFIVGCNHAEPSTPQTKTEPQDKPAPLVAPKQNPDALAVLPNPSELKRDKAPIHALPADGSDVILIFKTLQFIKDTGASPEGFFMRGKMMNGAFQPSGKLEGQAKTPVGGTPGWVELHTGQFFPAMTSRAPAKPFIEGRMTTVGFFPNQPILPKNK